MAQQRERRGGTGARRPQTSSYRSTETLERYEQAGRQGAAVKEYKAALEALFQKKPEAVQAVERILPTVKLARLVETPSDAGPTPPNKRQEMLRKIGAAQGSRPISDALDVFFAAGHTLPDDQEVYLQMLEHRDEARVREAITRLEHLLAGQLPKRKPVLVQRLKRLEEDAEESATRDLALGLRRKVG